MIVSMKTTDEVELLEKYLTSVCPRDRVWELRLTNCVVGSPDALLSLILGCPSLRTLRCVACSAEPYDILRFILPMQKTLHTVEFTLDERMSEKQVRSICFSLATAESPEEFLNLRYVYVEVSGIERMDVIISLMNISVNVSHLHVHFLRGNFAEAVVKCKMLWDCREHLSSFTFTSEVPSTACLFSPQYMSPVVGGAICGNVLYTRKPHTSWNCFMMNELAMRQRPLRPGRETVVVVPWWLTAVQMMREAGVRNTWSDVRNLCVALIDPSSYTHYPCAGVAFHEGLVDFLRHFRNNVEYEEYEHLTELNVNSFHCAADLDMTEVLFDAGLTWLTALSLSPCGVQRLGSLRRLTVACPFLNDLDVRVYSDVLRCSRCQQDLQLSSKDAAELSVGRNGGRLTFVGVPRFKSLDFLSRCNVRELRMGGSSMVAPEQLGDPLVFNERLRCLVLGYDNMQFDARLYNSLKKLHNLRLLCLRSCAYHETLQVKGYIQSLGSFMNHLKVLHVHYTGPDGSFQRLTWVRHADTIEELRYELDDVLIEPVLCGRVLSDAPCVICTMQTFIGLVKPKYRDVHTKF
ncbi:uncharacterized protein LOC119404170 [Rhipicephalus sanguineus]|uniref:Uncharacterized protein n=1 Tax=Rhipicephalus sanguineus TaxID=34632 RepID=A0A9D4PCG5_RHISA|nr:uncharacterized protein LOC119404170 [Rhipicephalus sanguineus]KAH7934889.1 hypothetical protein HPB52_001831 [Rhipicephalus sanguineus]